MKGLPLQGVWCDRIAHMFEDKKIRSLAVCIIKHDGKLLSGIGHDSVKKDTFYRLLGGGIEFGEWAEDALKREFGEELGTDLENIKYLTTLENIFTYEGKTGHEIVFVFQGELSNKELYERDNISINDDKDSKAVWQKIEDFKSGKLILYPEGIAKFI